VVIDSGYYQHSTDTGEGMCSALYGAFYDNEVITEEELRFALNEINEYVGGPFHYLYRELIFSKVAPVPEGYDDWDDIPDHDRVELLYEMTLGIYKNWAQRPDLS
jgi:hypothetical protein